ncbi:MAG: hypothetical protein MUC43_15445 [Pirellula sp.]|jgi:hypothetical protein|nr:hypothetical protein [Pirellula sp.]
MHVEIRIIGISVFECLISLVYVAIARGQFRAFVLVELMNIQLQIKSLGIAGLGAHHLI